MSARSQKVLVRLRFSHRLRAPSPSPALWRCRLRMAGCCAEVLGYVCLLQQQGVSAWKAVCAQLVVSLNWLCTCLARFQGQ